MSKSELLNLFFYFRLYNGPVVQPKNAALALDFSNKQGRGPGFKTFPWKRDVNVPAGPFFIFI